MGDSDDEYNSGNVNNNTGGNNAGSGAINNGNNGGGGGGGGHMNSNKRGRDKFYRERDDVNSSNNDNSNGNNSYNNNNHNNRRDWNNDRSRSNDSWKNRGGNMMSSGGYNNNRMGMNDYPRKYQNNSNPYDASPPMYKKNRKDWEGPGNDGYGGGSTYSPMSGNNMYGNSPSMQHQQQQQNPYQQNQDMGKSQLNSDYPTQPPLLSFKMFLQQQDDGISDEEAIRRYNQYKIEFRKTQINNFFLEHKEEEWFKSRYYPEESLKRRQEQNQCIINRLDTFMNLLNDGWLNDVSCENDKSKELIRFLDAVVIKLEGGTDEDLKALDGTASNPTGATVGSDESSKASEEAANKSQSDESAADKNGDDQDEESKENGKASKRKSEDSGSESGAYTDDSDNNDEKPHKRKKRLSKSEGASKPATAKTGGHQLHKTASIFMRNLAPSVTKQDLENLCNTNEGFKRVALSDPAPDRGFFRRGWITFESNVDVKKICWSLQNIKIRGFNPGAIVNRELSNRVRSITNLLSHHKSVVKNDIKLALKIIENMDKRWNLWQEEKTATEKNGEADKEKDEEKEGGSGEKEGEQSTNPEDAIFNKSSLSTPQYIAHKFNGPNPLLDNITDYLVDEVDAEEEELLGDSSELKNKQSKSGSIDIEIDKNYNKVLDKLILYLRVVHSIDFYNSIEYQQEDSMPNRCGIVFVRPSLPQNAASASLKITQEECNVYIQQFETKMKPYIEYKEKIDAEMAAKLGLKDIREEIEKFIKINTQELAPDRWLCPLSGKKFKGPEFIRKHLFYKHIDKINEVKQEVEFFNGYLLDPKRPQLPEHPSNKPSAANANSSGMQGGQQMNFNSNQMLSNNNINGNNNNYQMGNQGMMGSPLLGQMPFNMMQNRQMNVGGWQQPNFGGMPQMQQQAANFGQFNQGYNMGGAGYQGYKKGGSGYGGARRGNNREMIQYKDLDAPDDN